MSLTVLPDESKLDISGGFVVVEDNNQNRAAAIDSLRSNEAQRMALEYAAKQGCPDPGVGFPSAPYPVDSEGKPVTGNDASGAVAYRVNIAVAAKS